MEGAEHQYWVYGALVLAFTVIGYLYHEIQNLKSKIQSLESTNKSYDIMLPLINQKLDQLSNTVSQFLKQEIDSLKAIAEKVKGDD